MRLRLGRRGKLMLKNFRLKIRAIWDSDIENRSSIFFSKIKGFWQEQSTSGFFLPKSYLWTKNERNWFFNFCHDIKILLDSSWPSLWNLPVTLNSVQKVWLHQINEWYFSSTKLAKSANYDIDAFFLKQKENKKKDENYAGNDELRQKLC